MNIIKVFVFSIFSVFISLEAYGQDPAFSQYFGNPLYLNPAFAGTAVCPRVNLNYRNQWPGIGQSYVTYTANYDAYVDKIGGGLGLFVMNDRAGAGDLNILQVSGIYSYRIPVSKKFSMNAGLEASYRQLSLDWSQLTFGDMIDPRYGFIYPTQEDIVNYASTKGYVDFSTGLIGYGRTKKTNYYFGFAAHHITKPDQGFISDDSYLPTKFTFNVGAVVPVNQFGVYRTNSSMRSQNGVWVSPNFLLQKQQDFLQLNYGVYAIKGPLVGGLWLRQSKENFDAFIVLVGFEGDNWKIGYSYDITISELNNSNTQGAHELSFALRLPCRSKTRGYETINCPSF